MSGSPGATSDPWAGLACLPNSEASVSGCVSQHSLGTDHAGSPEGGCEATHLPDHREEGYSLRFNAQHKNREVGNTHAERAKPLTSQQKSRRCLFPEGAEGSKEFVKTCECTYVAGPHMQSRPKVRPWGLAHCLKN